MPRLFKSTVSALFLSLFCLGCSTQAPISKSSEGRAQIIQTDKRIVWYAAGQGTLEYRSQLLKDLTIDTTAAERQVTGDPQKIYLSMLGYKNSMRRVLAGILSPVRKPVPGTLEISASLSDQLRDPELIYLARQQGLSAPILNETTLIMQFRDAVSGKLIAALATREFMPQINAALYEPASLAQVEQAYAPLAELLADALARRKTLAELHK